MPPVSPRRITLRRIKGWKMPAHTLRVARPSRRGNPFIVGRFYVRLPDDQGWLGSTTRTDEHEWIHIKDNATAVEWFKWNMDRLIRNKVQTHPEMTILEELELLRGWNLACWCKEGFACHVDYLLELANSPKS